MTRNGACGRSVGEEWWRCRACGRAGGGGAAGLTVGRPRINTHPQEAGQWWRPGNGGGLAVVEAWQWWRLGSSGGLAVVEAR